jgi:hypothetical protein
MFRRVASAGHFHSLPHLRCMTTLVGVGQPDGRTQIAGRVRAAPADRLTEVTEGARTSYGRQIAVLKTRGIDTTHMERRGAPGIFRVLIAVACHEAGHRGTLYSFLRLNGVSLIGFQPSYLIFPTPGCWEVTALVGAHEDSKLTFVTNIVKIGEGPSRWNP